MLGSKCGYKLHKYRKFLTSDDALGQNGRQNRIQLQKLLWKLFLNGGNLKNLKPAKTRPGPYLNLIRVLCGPGFYGPGIAGPARHGFYFKRVFAGYGFLRARMDRARPVMD